MFYSVLEIQVNDKGKKSSLITFFDVEEEAYAKYYSILSVAISSNLVYHSAHIIRDDGLMIEGKVFDRREKNETEE